MCHPSVRRRGVDVEKSYRETISEKTIIEFDKGFIYVDDAVIKSSKIQNRTL